MLDAFTLDQIRTLILVAEEGSFSAAARKLRRVQSAVSTSMANLESQLGLSLWERSERSATLTQQGHAVLRAAKRVAAESDALRALASGMASGIEPSVSLCVEQIFPTDALVSLCRQFAMTFPSVDLRVDAQTMSAVSARVRDGRASLGVVGPLGIDPTLERHPLSAVRMVSVVAATHSLAHVRGKVSAAKLRSNVQIVLSERSDDGVPDQAVLSERTWRVADLHTKHALLLAGLGWGNLPIHLAAADLKAGRLQQIHPAPWQPHEHTLYLSAVFQSRAKLGPAHLWMLAKLEEVCAQPLSKVPHRPKSSKAH